MSTEVKRTKVERHFEKVVDVFYHHCPEGTKLPHTLEVFREEDREWRVRQTRTLKVGFELPESLYGIAFCPHCGEKLEAPDGR